MAKLDDIKLKIRSDFSWWDAYKAGMANRKEYTLNIKINWFEGCLWILILLVLLKDFGVI